MKKHIILATAILALSGCASASKPGAMVPTVSAATLIKADSPLTDAITVGDVTGGKKTNPLWTSEVASEDFAEALRQSFAAHAMLATDSGDYRLDADLEKLKQPVLGTSMKVTSTVKYTLTDVSTGAVVFEDTIETPYTAKFSDSFVAVKRLQLANEGSIKTNIGTMIERIIAAVDSGSAPIALRDVQANTL